MLVGFKYHADVLAQLDATGQYGDYRGTTADFVMATEESHGAMATAELRDKDSACAALLMAEAALLQKRQGQTLVDYLDSLARQFGYFRNEVLNIVMTGLEGKQNMARMLDAFRSSPPKDVAGLPVDRGSRTCGTRAGGWGRSRATPTGRPATSSSSGSRGTVGFRPK